MSIVTLAVLPKAAGLKHRFFYLIFGCTSAILITVNIMENYANRLPICFCFRKD